MCACLALAAPRGAPLWASSQTEIQPAYHGAIATHPDIMDAWFFAAKAGAGSENALKQKALEACLKAMGSGCGAETWTNGYVVLSRNGPGVAQLSQASTKEQALADAAKGCDERWQLPCEVLVVFGASDKFHLADPIRHRKTHGFAVWVKTAPGEVDPRAWIATGYRTGTEAREAAMAACVSQSAGKACEDVASVTNGFLQAFTDGKTRVGFVAESNMVRARQAMHLVCNANGQSDCSAQSAYSSRKTGVYLHDFATGQAKPAF